MNGLDDIDFLVENKDKIEAWENKNEHNHPKIEIWTLRSATVNRPAESPLCPMRS